MVGLECLYEKVGGLEGGGSFMTWIFGHLWCFFLKAHFKWKNEGWSYLLNYLVDLFPLVITSLTLLMTLFM